MDDRLSKYENKMQKSLDNLSGEYAAIRAGRANPHILDRVMVDYYGTPTPVAQVGNIAIPEARIITITPWDKSMMKAIIKAIETSDIGINPGNDGNTIRLVFPELSEERRKELSKDVKKKGEECKVAIRNIRRDGNDEVKKLTKTEDMSEDSVKDLQDQLQKLTDKYIKKVDEAAAAKEKEIMTV
ncbi:MAG: ribosome recycling factor [Lachnospiraceae bacterium]|nr:ribosome recycling factor [Lachnospiraceae bacterium]